MPVGRVPKLSWHCNTQAIVVKLDNSATHQCSRSPVTVRTVSKIGEEYGPRELWSVVIIVIICWGAAEARAAPFMSSVQRSASTDSTDSLDEWRQDMPVPVHLRLFRNQLITRPSAPPNAPKALLGSSPLTVSSFFNPNSRKQRYPRSLISRRVRTRTSSVPQMRQTSSSLRLGCASAWSAILNGTSRSVSSFCLPWFGIAYFTVLLTTVTMAMATNTETKVCRDARLVA
jgi:hypothetical protein